MPALTLAPGFAARAADRRPDVAIILKAVDGAWQSLGTELGPGIFAEQVNVAVNEHGPDTCSFLLRRRAGLPWVDLMAFNRCEIHIDGVPVFGGRIWEAPLSTGGEDTIAVAGRGWQYHLDDDLLLRSYVHTNLADFRDQRAASPTVNLDSWISAANVVAEQGSITIGYPTGTVVPANGNVGVVLDLGAADARRVVVTYETSANAATEFTFIARGASNIDGTVSTSDALSVNLTAAGPTTGAGTLSANKRYLLLFLNCPLGLTTGVLHWVRIKAVQVFRSTTYESGNASVLKADQVIKDAIATAPLLSSDTSLIDAGSFSIPDLSTGGGYQTPRQVMDAANAYEGNLLGVDAQRRLFFRERDVAPLLEVGPWPGSAFQDASTNSAEELFNQVIVQGTSPDGAAVREIRTATSSLLDRQGFTRTSVLSVSAPITTLAAQTLGDIWLGDQSSPKFRGTMTVQGHGGARLVAGGDVHASTLLMCAGQVIRLGLVDLETGAWTRDALIKLVRYDHASETATLELDNERGNFGTLLSRYGVRVGQALGT